MNNSYQRADTVVQATAWLKRSRSEILFGFIVKVSFDDRIDFG